MIVELEADDRRWLAIPSAFPTDTGLDHQAWEDQVVRGMRTTWDAASATLPEDAVRQALRLAVGGVGDDSITLQFWPAASVANVIVHVAVREFAPGEPTRVLPLDDAPYVVEPVSTVIESDHLGTGVESRFLVGVDAEPPLSLGAVNFLFENDRGHVFVGTDATLPGLIGLMLEPLRAVVRTIRVHDDEIGPWRRATVDPGAIPARGEFWPDAPPRVLAG